MKFPLFVFVIFGEDWSQMDTQAGEGDVVPWDRGCYSCHANQYRAPDLQRRVNYIVGYKTRQHPFQPNERTIFPANMIDQHREDGVDSNEEKHRGGDDEKVLQDKAIDEEGDGEEDCGYYS